LGPIQKLVAEAVEAFGPRRKPPKTAENRRKPPKTAEILDEFRDDTSGLSMIQ
jgi:hypothetical protein